MLDRAEDSEPIEQLVLRGVTDFQVNLIDDRDERTDSWPSYDAQSNSPVSLEVLIETQSIGQIRRFFTLPVLAKPLTTPGGSSADDDDSSEGENRDTERQASETVEIRAACCSLP